MPGEVIRDGRERLRAAADGTACPETWSRGPPETRGPLVPLATGTPVAAGLPRTEDRATRTYRKPRIAG